MTISFFDDPLRLISFVFVLLFCLLPLHTFPTLLLQFHIIFETIDLTKDTSCYDDIKYDRGVDFISEETCTSWKYPK